MKPVEQTMNGKPLGDCMRACVASLLELDIGDVPNPHGDNWCRLGRALGLADVAVCANGHETYLQPSS